MLTKNFDPSKPVVVSQPHNPGPTSLAGKAISSRNAMRHGCCATETLLLPHESADDLKALEALWLNTYLPKADAERHLIAQLVEADWFLQRSTRALAHVEAALYAASPNPADWTEQQERKLARFLRYRTAHANNVHKCRKAVEDYRQARVAELRAEEKSVMTKERHELYKEKNKPQPTVQELIQNMLREKREREERERLGLPHPEKV